MKKRILLIALAAVLLLGGALAVWQPWQQLEEPTDSGWVWPNTRTSGGALSEHGYYYVPSANSALTYMDFAAGANVTLCSRMACNHDAPVCDASMTGNRVSLAFHRDHIYYIYDNGIDRITKLCRRDAAGMAMVEIGVLGAQFAKTQKAVELNRYAPLGDWLYYEATVSGFVQSENGYATQLKELKYIGRIHLTTGKDEVLVESGVNDEIHLCGVAAGTQFEKEAVMLLNLIAEDEAFRNQLLYGREGRDYIVQDGLRKPVRLEDDVYYSMDFLSPYSLLSSEEEVRSYREMMDKVETVFLPVAFDYSAFKEEIGELANILGKYYYIFGNHIEKEYTSKGVEVYEPRMDEVTYDQMLQELSDAGTNEIQAELQRQLDAWLAANPDWQ